MLDMKRSEDWLKRSCWIWCGSLCGSALVRRRNNDIRICDGIKTPDASLRLAFLVAFLFSTTSTAFGQFNDKSVDMAALPKVPDEFTVTLFASEPMVRQPCSMAFDERGRLFVGMGPQYRNPTPETPGDSVVIVQDTDGDGRADETKEFATGVNAIQGLAWHGRDLWVANAPDLTVVRDRDGDAGTASETSIASVRNVKVLNNAGYKVVPGGFAIGSQAYVDRSYRLRSVAAELVGCDLIQTANDDDGSRGALWLTAESRVPVRVWVGIDARQKRIPGWLLKGFQKTEFIAEIDEGAKFIFYEKSFSDGRVELGGNTDDGQTGGKGNYLVAVAPLPIGRLESKSSLDATLAMLEHGDRERGELLFRHPKGAGCFKCHSLDQSKNGFGPNLSNLGLRSNAKHIAQSVVNPSAVITEGFSQQIVVTNSGQIHSGVLLEESGLTLSLGLSNGERIDIPKASIEERKSSSQSAMPEMNENLTPQQIADLVHIASDNRGWETAIRDRVPIEDKHRRIALSVEQSLHADSSSQRLDADLGSCISCR